MRHIFSPKNRALLTELVRTDFKIRYQNSVLGYAWTLLRPLFIFMILYVVFVKLIPLGKGVPHYPIYLLLGIVLWNFFVEMTSQSLGSIVSRGDLIRKIKIPRWIIVLTSSLSALINLGLNLIVVAVFMILSHTGLLSTIIYVPFILIELYLFALGLSLFLSAAYVKYRDVQYIWEVLLQAGFYATPIIYALSRIPNIAIRKLLLMNPVAQSIQDVRYSLITHQSITISNSFTNKVYFFIPLFIVLVTLLIGITYFRKESKYFAENI